MNISNKETTAFDEKQQWCTVVPSKTKKKRLEISPHTRSSTYMQHIHADGDTPAIFFFSSVRISKVHSRFLRNKTKTRTKNMTERQEPISCQTQTTTQTPNANPRFFLSGFVDGIKETKKYSETGGGGSFQTPPKKPTTQKWEQTLSGKKTKTKTRECLCGGETWFQTIPIPKEPPTQKWELVVRKKMLMVGGGGSKYHQKSRPY